MAPGGRKEEVEKLRHFTVLVYRQQMLLAYEWDPRTRVLLLLGSHENFYRDLKRP